jgi:peptide/nickel transport system ATP-binding protein
LEARDVMKVYGGGKLARQPGVTVLDGFSLAFREEEPRIVALAGQSGSGKTTAAHLLLGFVQPTSGEVLYGGTSVAKLRGAARREFRRNVQAILQDPYASFNPFYRVRHVFDVIARNFEVGSSTAGTRRLIDEAVAFVGLDPARVLDKFPHQLSGGERQRIMIARAFVLRPRIIVADEPVSMVDASIRSAILEIIIRLNKEEGISFLYVTHDLSTAYHLADELVVLYEGETVERGDARSVIDEPKHDYTRLLVDSVPVPDPSVRWGGGTPLAERLPRNLADLTQ